MSLSKNYRSLDDLKRIAMVYKMDGYITGTIFHAREVAWIGMDAWDRPESARFDTSHLEPTGKDLATCLYSVDRLHGLPMVPSPCETDLKKPEDLETVIWKAYFENCTPDRIAVAVKGGQFERPILERMGIPVVHLDHFHCPKYEHLWPLDNDHHHHDDGCGWHAFYNGAGKFVCPQTKVKSFRDWILVQTL